MLADEAGTAFVSACLRVMGAEENDERTEGGDTCAGFTPAT